MFNSFKKKINENFNNQFDSCEQVLNPKFQINNFDNILSFRFNVEFLKQFLNLYSESPCLQNKIFADNLIKDIGEIITRKSECFITDEYHMGIFSDIIYFNVDKKYSKDICDIMTSLCFFPPAFFKFKQVLLDVYYFSNISQPKKAENF